MLVFKVFVASNEQFSDTIGVDLRLLRTSQQTTGNYTGKYELPQQNVWETWKTDSQNFVGDG
jgi:hypothetical protein